MSNKEVWPNFFIIGALRCGTTSLYEYLKHSKDVYMSPVKEPNYFSRNNIPDDYIFAPIRSKAKYLALFSDVKDEIAIGEASPTYLQDEKAPCLIHEIIPNSKIIMILRDPIDRAFSHYLHFVSIGFEKRAFRTAINENLSGIDNTNGKNYVGAGMYSEQVARYIKLFGKENVKILIFDEFSKNTRESILEILKFLKIPNPKYENEITIYNKYSNTTGPISAHIIRSTNIIKLARRLIPEPIRINFREKLLTKKIQKPSMKEADKQLLQKIYQIDTKKLSNYLNLELPWS